MGKQWTKSYSFERSKLKEGNNEYQFKIDRSFFAEFEDSLIEEGNLEADVQVMKYNTHLDLTLKITGTVQLACDRCLEPYPYPIETEHRLIYSFDEMVNFDTEEVILLQDHDNWVDLSPEFYDFICLEIPLRKVPEEDVHTCDPAVLEMLGEGESAPEEASDEEKPTDPRWEALKKLKFDDNK